MVLKAKLVCTCFDLFSLYEYLLTVECLLLFIFQLLCIIVEEEADIAAFKDFVPTAADDSIPSSGPPPAAAPTPTPALVSTPPPVQAAPIPMPAAPTSAPPTTAPATTGGNIAASPYARTLAAEKGVDLKVRE